MLIAFFAAGLIAAAPLDAPHAAVLSVLSRGTDAAPCSDAKRREIATQAKISRLGSIGGDDVVLAEVYDPCVCGAQNCPFYALRITPGKPRVLLSTFGIGINTKPGTPLPVLVVRAHDSAMVSAEETYTYRGGAYAVTDSARVRGDTGARKKSLPVHFASGASSANLRGSISSGWYDEYVFDASKGQQLVLAEVRSRANVRLTLYGPILGASADLRAGVPYTLPADGRYSVQVDNDSVGTDVPYTLTLAIKPRRSE